MTIIIWCYITAGLTYSKTVAYILTLTVNVFNLKHYCLRTLKPHVCSQGKQSFRICTNPHPVQVDKL